MKQLKISAAIPVVGLWILFSPTAHARHITPGISFLRTTPEEITGGSPATGELRIGYCGHEVGPPNDPSECLVKLRLEIESSDPSVASVPGVFDTVASPEHGGTLTSFPITTYPVVARTVVDIIATQVLLDQGSGEEIGRRDPQVRSLTVCPADPVVASLVLPSGVTGGLPADAEIGLDCLAPPGGRQVHLATNLPSIVEVPPTVVIPEGETSHLFEDLIQTNPVSFPRLALVIATTGDVSVSTLLVIGSGLENLNLKPHKRGIEVTQAIQCLGDDFCPDNGVPLVAGKPTAVRVYARAEEVTIPIPGVRGTLYARPCGGSESDWIGQLPIWEEATIHPDLNDELERQRESPSSAGATAHNLTFALDFRTLPTDCLDLRADINPSEAIFETDYGDNRIELDDVRFHSTRSLAVKFVRIRFFPNLLPSPGEPEYTPEWSTIYPMIDYVERVYPVARVKHWKARSVVKMRHLDFDDNGYRWSVVLADLALLQLFSGDTGMHYYALLDDRVEHRYSGMAWLPPFQKVGAGHAGHVGGGTYERSARTFAHEIAHNLGREHAPCGDPDGIDPSWPDLTNRFADVGAVGFDVEGGFSLATDRDNETVEEFNPNDITDFKDFMSYCGPEAWISPYTYEALFEALGGSYTSTGLALEGGGALSDHLVVRGAIDDEGQVFFSPTYHFETTRHDSLGGGTHRLVLRAADGSELFSRLFSPQSEPGVPGQGSFFELVPYSPETARIDIGIDGFAGFVLLASQEISANPPEVELLSPNGGELLDGSEPVAVTWTASDADGDELTYTVLLSRDGGTTWEAFATGLEETSFALDPDELPGTDQAMVRVMASDGVNTGSDDSDTTFEIPGKSPDVTILRPYHRAGTLASTALLLSGTATDPEDGPLPEKSLHWTSNLDGVLGEGSHLVVTLSPGRHEITLTGRDSNGNSTSAVIEVLSVVPLIFADGFESGAAEAWSATSGGTTNG